MMGEILESLPSTKSPLQKPVPAQRTHWATPRPLHHPSSDETQAPGTQGLLPHASHAASQHSAINLCNINSEHCSRGAYTGLLNVRETPTSTAHWHGRQAVALLSLRTPPAFYSSSAGVDNLCGHRGSPLYAATGHAGSNAERGLQDAASSAAPECSRPLLSSCSISSGAKAKFNSTLPPEKGKVVFVLPFSGIYFQHESSDSTDERVWQEASGMCEQRFASARNFGFVDQRPSALHFGLFDSCSPFLRSLANGLRTLTNGRQHCTLGFLTVSPHSYGHWPTAYVR
mmetsp:Transcript_4019/g.9169  ORF Transcript_4019/g.9169 Transcript_4019/m.9169 type:complete len:286 (+) Transcript_4019:1053-1910(+)